MQVIDTTLKEVEDRSEDLQDWLDETEELVKRIHGLLEPFRTGRVTGSVMYNRIDQLLEKLQRLRK
jgi:hypothetical protein